MTEVSNVDVALRILEMAAILFPAIIIVVQLSVRLVANRELDLSMIFTVGFLAVGYSLLNLLLLSFFSVGLLEKSLPGEYETIISYLRFAFVFLFIGAVLVFYDAFSEIRARADSSESTQNNNPDGDQSEGRE